MKFQKLDPNETPAGSDDESEKIVQDQFDKLQIDEDSDFEVKTSIVKFAEAFDVTYALKEEHSIASYLQAK